MVFDTVPRASGTVSITRGSGLVRRSTTMRARALNKKSCCKKNRKSKQKVVLLQFETVPKNDTSNEGEAIQTLRLISKSFQLSLEQPSWAGDKFCQLI